MMREPFNPEMLVLARMSRGLTQQETARELDVSQGYVSKMEHGFLVPDESLIAQMSKALDYPPEFFYQPGYIVPLPWWFHTCGVRTGF